jgi:hypothetical protein
MLCRKQKRAACMEALGSRKMPNTTASRAHEDFASNEDLGSQISLAQHSLAQPLRTVAVGAPRRRHTSPHMIPIKPSSTESWTGTSRTADSCSMVVNSTHNAWRTPDKDDYHGDCTGSTLVRADLISYANDDPDDPLALPCQLGWRSVSTEWYETVMLGSSSDFSPPVLARPQDPDTARDSPDQLLQASGVHSLTKLHNDYSSETLLPFPPVVGCEDKDNNIV